MTLIDPKDDQDHTLEKNPEREPAVIPEVTQPPEGFKSQLTPTPSRKGKLALAIAGTAAVAGGALYALTGGGGSDNTYPAYPLPHAERPDAPGVKGVPVPTDESITPSTQPEVEAVPVIEPVLITADTPGGILEQFGHNLTCFYNNRDYVAQQKCLSYIMGDDESDLSTLFNERLSRVIDYRATHPDFEVDQDYANTISKFYPNDISPESVVIVSELTDNTGTTSKVRYTFVKNKLTEQQYDVEDQPIEAWMLYREEGLEPGEPDFVQ